MTHIAHVTVAGERLEVLVDGEGQPWLRREGAAHLESETHHRLVVATGAVPPTFDPSHRALSISIEP